MHCVSLNATSFLHRLLGMFFSVVTEEARASSHFIPALFTLNDDEALNVDNGLVHVKRAKIGEVLATIATLEARDGVHCSNVVLKVALESKLLSTMFAGQEWRWGV